MIRERFQKFVGMGPAVVQPPSAETERTMVHDMDRSRLRSQLSPVSSGKAHQLEAPTKKGLADYDKNMTSLAASIQKALNTLQEYMDKIEKDKARERARQERLQKELTKRANKKAKMLQKARQEGEDLAGEEMANGAAGDDLQAALEDNNEDEDDQADEDDVGFWPLVDDANDLGQPELSWGNVSILANQHCKVFVARHKK